LLNEVSVREKLDGDTSYRLLGVRWWGEGSFIRETKLGREIKARSLYRVTRGWIVYNRLFAYRGSFAIVSDDHDGAHASGEFPTFAVKPEIAYPDLVSRYIVACLNSPQYLKVVDARSTGSTKQSRNRFNQKLFLDLTLPLPKSDEALRQLVDVLEQADTLRREQDRLLSMAKSMREGIMSLLPSPPSTDEAPPERKAARRRKRT
jgi:hypothetical protein